MRPTAPQILALTAALAAGTLTACGGGGAGDKNTVRIAFHKETDNKVTFRDDYLKFVAKKFEKRYPGKKIDLVPIQATQQDYYTKIQQMMRSPKTAPDLVYEDTFLINSDIKSGYLRPLDNYLAKWDDWKQFEPAAKRAAGAADGQTYGVPDGTDTRGLWFNKKLFKKAGLPQDWRPKTWDEVLKAARTLKRKVPGVIPLNVYAGKGAGEATAMQGFEMLLYGTGKDPLYDPKAKKWVKGGKGFRESLEFLDTVYSEHLGPDEDQMVDPNVTTDVATELLPKGKLAIALDGSWLSQFWIKTGGKPWPEWKETMGLAPMPTQHGRPPGEVSMSGGWTWSIPRHSDNPDLAWKMIRTMQTKENAVEWCIRGSQVAVRQDVADDPRYRKSMPGTKFFTQRVEHTHYRPALPAYPRVSAAIAEATEAVATGDSSPQAAAKAYDEQLDGIADGATVTK
ncbi:ABC transporter substrate-binding protein [Streptomyces spirodelae]|uniref:ABC transporter substrate-binding protein n=1 Tax=Streptomyces spirodelae TaxID=2812904 RepID=A0ABS3WSH9_9ACTN|nr:ABC transporter substrate-binding protein [Streptomyces spirodelae]MBO8185826.1 ABC transporter substrate-binding protein [Streptomyces spirodelae]